MDKLKKLFAKQSFRKIAGNSWWLLFDKIFRLFIVAIVSIWIARYLGPEDFGVLNYSLAFIGFFGPFIALGLNHIITRDIVNEGNYIDILGTSFLLRFISGLVCTCLAYLLIYIIRPNAGHLHIFILILGFGQTLRSFSILDYWFQSRLESKYVAISRSVALIFVSTLKVGAILIELDLIYFVILFSLEYALSEMILAAAYKYKGESIFEWKFKIRLAVSYLKDVSPLILAGFATVIYMKIDKFMLGEMISDEAVGIYSAAAQLSEAWYAIPVALAASFFPKLLDYKKHNKTKYYASLEGLMRLMVIIALLISVPIALISQQIIDLLYGPSYHGAGVVLAVHIWASIFIFARAVLSKWILAENLLKFAFISQLFGAITNIILNLILIPVYQELGSAIATVISYSFASYLFLFFFKETKRMAYIMTSAIFLPHKVFKDV